MAKTHLRRYPLATVDVLANAGHYPMKETPLAPVAAIESFLLAVDGATDVSTYPPDSSRFSTKFSPSLASDESGIRTDTMCYSEHSSKEKRA